jgi:probable addiction module antidote protein
MTGVAKEAGVTREALYKALTENGDPKLSTLLGVLRALGLSLSAKPSADAEAGKLRA